MARGTKSHREIHREERRPADEEQQEHGSEHLDGLALRLDSHPSHRHRHYYNIITIFLNQVQPLRFSMPRCSLSLIVVVEHLTCLSVCRFL